jgi:CheY-like chemotaxis protein
MPKLRALVADDDVDMLSVVSKALLQFGAEVVVATSGGELLEKIANGGNFDVIVTDISMPWMTGLQVMHSARTAGLRVPVVVMTALRDPMIPEQVASLGCVRRHSFGTMMAKRVPLGVLQQLMGHTDVQTTMRYIDVSEADKRDAIAVVFGARGSHVAAASDVAS